MLFGLSIIFRGPIIKDFELSIIGKDSLISFSIGDNIDYYETIAGARILSLN